MRRPCPRQSRQDPRGGLCGSSWQAPWLCEARWQGSWPVPAIKAVKCATVDATSSDRQLTRQQQHLLVAADRLGEGYRPQPGWSPVGGNGENDGLHRRVDACGEQYYVE